MRIKIIGDNNCARATRHLLRLGGFAVTEYLPADALAGGPLSGYAITIELAPANFSPDAHLRPDPATLQLKSANGEEAARINSDTSSLAFAKGATASEPALGNAAAGVAALVDGAVAGGALDDAESGGGTLGVAPACVASLGDAAASDSAVVNGSESDRSAVAPARFRSEGGIHFDSVDSELEAAVLRHVTQLASAPVVIDRPGGVVHSSRELRIVLPNTGDAEADEAAAVAVEFGVLRGLLDLSAAGGRGVRTPSSDAFADEAADRADRGMLASRRFARIWKWWPFAVILGFLVVGFFLARVASRASRLPHFPKSDRLPFATAQGKRPALLEAGVFSLAQGQYDTGQGVKISDGNSFLIIDPCLGQTKLYASINQTASTQLVAGTVSKKIYVCSLHVVAAAATNVALVEGTGSVCGTGTAGVGGFGGATAATGWNFAANGGIALGNGASSLGAEITSGDNLCVFSSGSGQVSGGISYVVQ